MRVVNAVLATALFAACSMPAEDGVSGTWELMHIEDAGAIYSVWGSGPNDVWAAGGQVGDGVVLHNDGSGFTPIEVNAPDLLVWIYGFAENDVYAVGERGLILHYDGESWQRAASATEQTLYGVWGASGSDVWIVGGDPLGDAGSAVVLRGHGESFAAVTGVTEGVLPGALFKIYGFQARDVIAVGSSGTVVRFDGDTWRRAAVPTTQPLFSLWGRAKDDLYAVGGYGPGELLHFDGDTWQKTAGKSFDHGLSGVFTAPGSPVIAVGTDAYVVEIEPGGLPVEPEMPPLPPATSLHGVWGDGAGTTYAVGGNLSAYPDPMTGVILRRR